MSVERCERDDCVHWIASSLPSVCLFFQLQWHPTFAAHPDCWFRARSCSHSTVPRSHDQRPPLQTHTDLGARIRLLCDCSSNQQDDDNQKNLERGNLKVFHALAP